MSENESCFACPICEEVVPTEFCPKHPNEIMDLMLPGRYVLGHCEGKYDIFLWDDDFETTEQVCTMTDPGLTGEIAGQKLVAVLDACHNVSMEALESGYIQALQDLPPFVEAYLASPDDLNSLRLLKQLARIAARRRDKN
jgi:hypothetical protein